MANQQPKPVLVHYIDFRGCKPIDFADILKIEGNRLKSLSISDDYHILVIPIFGESKVEILSTDCKPNQIKGEGLSETLMELQKSFELFMVKQQETKQ